MPVRQRKPADSADSSTGPTKLTKASQSSSKQSCSGGAKRGVFSCLCAFITRVVFFAAVLGFIGYNVIPPNFFVDEEDPLFAARAGITDRFSGQASIKSTTPDVPTVAYDKETKEYNWGRHLSQVADMSNHELNIFQRKMQYKQFVWCSITSRDYLVSFAVLDLGYMSSMVIAVYQRSTDMSYYRELQIPELAKWIPDERGFSGIAAGCVTFANVTALKPIIGSSATLCFNPKTNAMDVEVQSVLHKEAMVTPSTAPASINVDATFSIDLSKAFPTMVFPMGPNRASVVAKNAAARTLDGAVVKIDGKRVEATEDEKKSAPKFSDATWLGSFDYTRGMLRRETTWMWMSLNALDFKIAGDFTAVQGGTADTTLPKKTSDVTAFGMQLSSGTYDFSSTGGSSEASTYVNYRGEKDAKPKRAVVFYDTSATKWEKVDPSKIAWETKWRVTGPNLDLTFTPKGRFNGVMRYGIINGTLYHMWGTFTGTAPVSADEGQAQVEVVDAMGTLEEHYALW